MNITNAERSHARQLASLLNNAGEGIPFYLWESLRRADESALDVGEQRAAREEGGFSYRNARVCEEAGNLLGMCVSYRQPDSYDLSSLHEYPDIIRPLVVLESKAPGSWYINAVATELAAQGRGVGRALLADAERQAVEDDCSSMSLIVATENTRALGLYTYLGYQASDRLPVVDFPGSHFGGEWMLMIRELS